jgi:hypothetical protein
MGNVSVTFSEVFNAGNKTMTRGTLTLSTSYAASGDDFTVRALGLGTVDRLSVNPSGGYTFEADLTNNRIKAFAHARATTGVSATGGFALYVGSGATMTTSGTIVLTAASSEASAATNLSTVTARWDAIGN